MEGADNRETSLKELPTRELKLKRHKVRRDSPTIPPVRFRLKSSASSMNSETDVEKCLSDRSVSSSPDSVIQEHSPVFISTSPKVSFERNSTPSSPTDSINEAQFDSFTFITSSYADDDYDQPLDMSRKRAAEYSELSSIDSASSLQQQLRPSVITCASALLRTQCNLTDLAHNMCTINVNCDSNSNDADDDHCINHLAQKDKCYNDDINAARLGHRREIVSGSCDPVIDEHFRRSLGKDYQNIFSKSSGNNVSITVDDHFAKALGETWHQLQQTMSTADSVPSEHSPSSVQTQKPPQFLHQPPEILS